MEECANCGQTFEQIAKGYRRTALVSKSRPEDIVQGVIGAKITPKTGRSGQHFLCVPCEKLLKASISGTEAKKELFGKTSEGSYVSRKRKHSLHTPQAKRSKPSPRISTPLKTKQLRLSRGAKALANSEYKVGFRWYLKNSKAALKALNGIIKTTTRRDVKSWLRKMSFPLTQKASIAAFRALNWTTVLRSVRRKVPFLYNILVAAVTKKESDMSVLRGDSKISVKPVLGMVIAMLLKQVQPRKASLVQKMNAVQMWRAGAKRDLLTDFSHLGFTVGLKGLLATLDSLTKEFDSELRQWRFDIESSLYPADERHDRDAETTSITSSATEESSTSESSSDAKSSYSDDDQWSDVESISSQETVDETQGSSTEEMTEDSPAGYTICWDNVGRQVKTRHQTRNCGNKYYSWALAYAAKNRINTTLYTDDNVINACDVPLDAYYLTTDNMYVIQQRMKILISRILVTDLDCLSHLQDVPPAHIKHRYSTESRKKSEVFNIGILDENPSSTSGVINILDSLHAYVPRKDAQHLHQIVTWGDGLSCERHVDAQNARANSQTSLERLEGLEPSPQEFHKRMLLMQDTMNILFDGRSATDKGTLFYLKNVFNQRSVSKNVSESFNYVSEFLKFVTHGYVLLFALKHIGITSLSDSYPDDISQNDDDQNMQLLDDISTAILDEVWCSPTLYTTAAECTAIYAYCTCKEDLEEENEPMILCDNPDCSRGVWFHFSCMGITEDDVPPGSWFCSSECENHLNEYKFCICKTFLKDEPMVACDYPGCTQQWFHAKCVGITELPAEDDPWYCSQECRRKHKGKKRNTSGHQTAEDMKFEYTKMIVWRGLSDLVRRDAVRENDGPLMLLFWKMDMAAFASGNHYKYFILGHRLITAISGWKRKRIIEDLTWNRTVNLKGGAGHNNEMDLVNEFLNKEFKESIASAGSRLSADTLARHGKLAGGVGKHIDQVYRQITESHTIESTTHTDKDRREDIELFMKLMQPERLVEQIPGRSHKAFLNLNSSIQLKHVEKYNERITKWCKILDSRKREIAN